MKTHIYFKERVMMRLGIALCIGALSLWQSHALAFKATDSLYRIYVAKYQDLARKQMRNHGIPASITMAQALLESSGGQSALAIKSNNHFGIKCGKNWTGDTALIDDDRLKDCFRAYPSVDSSYADRVLFLGKARYKFLFDSLNVKDYQGWALGLKKAGYATDPTYPQRLIALIERLELQRLDDPDLVWPAPTSDSVSSINPNIDLRPSEDTAFSTPKEPSSMGKATVTVPDSAQLQYAASQGWIYITQKGDTPLSVSYKLGIDLYVLQAYNSLPLDLMMFEAGQVLIINRYRYQRYLKKITGKS